MSGNELILLAPLSGVIYSLERVPDPVFSQKLAGDGISIDPIDKDVDPNLITGVAASSGLAVGEVYQVRHVGIQVKEEGGRPTTSGACSMMPWPRRQGSLRPCAPSFMAVRNKRKQPSSPPTPNCLRILISSK